MRKLIVSVVVLLVLLTVADVAIREGVQHAIADHIETGVPAAGASVSISSFPFVGRLAASGTVPKVVAHAQGVTVDGLTFDRVDTTIDDLRVDRSRLAHGQVRLVSLRQATVTATVSQATLDREVGLPVTIGAGTVGLDGVEATAHLSVSGNRVVFDVPPLPAVSLTVPIGNLVPCVGDAQLQPGELVIGCTTNELPPVLRQYTVSMF